MKRNRLIFLHVPKTAGTAFRNQVLKKYYEPEQVYIFRGYRKAVKDLFLAKQNYKVITGHMSVGVHWIFRGAKYFSIIRDPIDRAISNYNYIPPPTERFTHPEWKYIKENSVAEYFSLPYKDNLMTRTFSGRSTSNSEFCTQVNYNEAIKNIKKYFLFIGIQNEFEKSCELFAKLYLNEENYNLTLRNENVAKVGSRPQRKIILKEEISEIEMAKLVQAHEYDQLLYQYVKTEFSNLPHSK